MISQKDREVLDRFQRAVGAGKICISRGMFYYYIYTLKADKVLSQLWPYLSRIKKEQATACGYPYYR